MFLILITCNGPANYHYIFNILHHICEDETARMQGKRIWTYL
jgi:hypothetical protein